MEDEELQEKVEQTAERLKQSKQEEEVKHDKKWEESILIGMTLTPPGGKPDKGNKSSKAPGSKDRTPGGSKRELPSPFAAAKKESTKAASSIKPTGSKSAQKK